LGSQECSSGLQHQAVLNLALLSFGQPAKFVPGRHTDGNSVENGLARHTLERPNTLASLY